MVGNGRIIFKFRRVLVQGAAYARESLDPIILQKTNAINYIAKTGLFGAILCPDSEQQKHPISLFKKKICLQKKKNTPFLNVPPFIFQQILTCSDTEINKKVSKQWLIKQSLYIYIKEEGKGRLITNLNIYSIRQLQISFSTPITAEDWKKKERKSKGLLEIAKRDWEGQREGN